MRNDSIQEIEKNRILKLRENIKLLPDFASGFFLEIANTTTTLTRLGYSYDLRLFFDYLIKEEPMFYKDNIKEFTFDDFAKIEARHIREFLDYLSLYVREFDSTQGKQTVIEETNGLRGKSRKLSAIRSIFNFYTNEEKIKHNPASLVTTPKLNKKEITYLDVNEVCDLLDLIESGDNLTKKQSEYHMKTRRRDLALIMLILSTGMRISECVMIDIEKIDFENSAILIQRKGSKEARVYYNEEVEEVLFEYIDERKAHFFAENKDSKKSAEVLEAEFLLEPLFTSLQNKRINVRTVQKLVKKYTELSTPFKTISPHKLRSTYATNLFRETNDIYMVADALGHSDINTTKIYAKVEDEQRRRASKYVKLR